MFDSLKKKFLSFFGKKEEENEETKAKKVVKEKKKAEKPAKKESKKTEKRVEKKADKKVESVSEKISDAEESAAPIVAATGEVLTVEEKEAEEEKGPEVDRKEEPEVIEGRHEEEPEEETEEGEKEAEEKKGFFARLAQKITASALSENDFDEFFDEFEMVLLEHNVALEVVDTIRSSLKTQLVGKHFKKSEASEKIWDALKNSIDGILIEAPDLLEQIKKKDGTFVIIFFGINGSGKTTTIARLGHFLKSKGISCVMAAGDTFRAASIEQLKHHGEKIGIPVVAQQYGADPAAVAFNAIQYAKKHGAKVVLIDTAGRMHTKVNLLREMEKIIRVAQPDLKLFVGEAIAGNDVVEQVKAFHENAGIDGLILTKADVDDKAGAILSVSSVTGKPIYFLGVGQNYEDIERFTKKSVLKNLGLE